MSRMIRPETVLNSWKTVRQDSAQAVEDFPATELDFRPTPEIMTFGEIARHILESGHAIAGLLLDGVEDMTTPAFREMLGKHVSELPELTDAASLAAALRQNLDMRAEQLLVQPDGFFGHVITRFDGQRVTRL